MRIIILFVRMLILVIGLMLGITFIIAFTLSLSAKIYFICHFLSQNSRILQIAVPFISGIVAAIIAMNIHKKYKRSIVGAIMVSFILIYFPSFLLTMRFVNSRMCEGKLVHDMGPEHCPENQIHVCEDDINWRGVPVRKCRCEPIEKHLLKQHKD